MLADILRSGFLLANRRPEFIFLDLLWKAIWIAVTAVVVVLFVFWFTSDIRSIEWQDTGVPALNGLVAAALLREFWSANRSEIIGGIVFAMSASAFFWFLLEAFFRRKMVRDVSHDDVRGPEGRSAHPLKVFFATGILKGTVVVAAVLVLSVIVSAGAGLLGMLILLPFAFFLTLMDSLVRADAVILLGTDLIRVAGLLGILMSFEAMIAAGFAGFLVAGFLNVAGLAGAAVMIGAAVAVVVFLTILHSYLLLVRFSAIAIMRKNVVEL